ncbi:hypothetical protein VNO80_04451 [Phaseolus coccineus]|uniref:Uncharacterized protein n=1 Tax=Phaseolus coccineus TaxID=3886 RepID=A0AAN9NUX8_PHACN
MLIGKEVQHNSLLRHLALCFVRLCYQSIWLLTRLLSYTWYAFGLLPVSLVLCRVFSSNQLRSPIANLKDLAIIFLRFVATNASGILVDAKMVIDDDNLELDIQQGLADCKENILDAREPTIGHRGCLLVDSKKYS